jgi:glycerol-3-phosphate cytidylyltransferase
MDRLPATLHAEMGRRLLPQRASVAPGRTVAITYGTYDLFHVGHVRLFERIKERFDFLIVAVSTDEFNAVKGKKSVVPFADRLEMVRACRHVDLAIAEQDWAQKESDIVRFGCDAFVMGSDWQGRFDTLKTLCEVIYLPRTEGVSSTELKQAVTATSPA